MNQEDIYTYKQRLTYDLRIACNKNVKNSSTPKTQQPFF